MYRCESCGRIAPPRTPSFLRVTGTRGKRYPARPKANVVRWRGRTFTTDDPGGVGVLGEQSFLRFVQPAVGRIPVEIDEQLLGRLIPSTQIHQGGHGDDGALAYYETFGSCPVGTATACTIVQWEEFDFFPGDGVPGGSAGTPRGR